MVKINFGCGVEQKFPGWINVDNNAETAPHVIADLSKDIPFPTNSVDFIFSEAFLEQLNFEQSRHFLRECHRILKPNGVMRLLAADLEKLVRTYLHEPEWLVETWDTTVGVPLLSRNACEVVNLGIRLGQFFFDRQTFRQLGSECGFRVEEVTFGQSEFPELRNLDMRRPEHSINMFFECYPSG